MSNDEKQICAIATPTAYEAVLREDGRLWDHWSTTADRLAGFSFNNRKCPFDHAMLVNERHGIACYLDRVH